MEPSHQSVFRGAANKRDGPRGGREASASTDGRGIPGALIESEDETVRAWVDQQFEAYRERSTALTVEDLPR